MENNYRITLYNTRFFSDLITYNFPVLPQVGDLIEVVEEHTLFAVKERIFKPGHNGGLIEVALHGVFENSENMGQHTFDKVREMILDQQ